MKQLTYLIDLYFSVMENEGHKKLTDKSWLSITSLLNEIEMTYFGDIGFYGEMVGEKIDVDKVRISLMTFMNYFTNGQLF